MNYTDPADFKARDTIEIRNQIDSWLNQFEAALAECDADKIAECFTEDEIGRAHV